MRGGSPSLRLQTLEIGTGAEVMRTMKVLGVAQSLTRRVHVGGICFRAKFLPPPQRAVFDLGSSAPNSALTDKIWAL